jgi:hypothetical protein
MKTALVATAILAFGVVSANVANAASSQRHVLSDSTSMAVGVPAGGSIDERSASTLYRQNLKDSGYNPKNDFVGGHMCSSCDFDGN